MIVSENIPYLEFFSYIEGKSGEKRSQEITAIFFPYASSIVYPASSFIVSSFSK